jgi:hypothetical protein
MDDTLRTQRSEKGNLSLPFSDRKVLNVSVDPSMPEKSESIRLRVEPEIKSLWQEVSDYYGISLSEYIRSQVPKDARDADVSEYVEKNARIQAIEEQQQWRYTALHLKDNISRAFASELTQVEPAKPGLVFDYLYSRYLSQTYEVFCRTEPKQKQRYRAVSRHLEQCMNDYIAIEGKTKSEARQAQAAQRMARKIHYSEGKDAATAFVDRWANETTEVLPSKKREIIKEIRNTTLEKSELSKDHGHNAEGGFSD